MNLTLKDLEQALQRSEENRAPNTFMFDGIRIIEAPARCEPVLKLRDDAPVSDAFREEMNAYLLNLFGSRDVSLLRPGQVIMLGGNAMMHPETAALLRLLSA